MHPVLTVLLFLLAAFLIVVLVAVSLNFGLWVKRSVFLPPVKTTRELDLERGAFKIHWYGPAEGAKPKALIVLGSGDTGWTGHWEDRVGSYLAFQGYAVAGLDFKSYAETDYSYEILGADTQRIVDELRGSYPDPELPLIISGWSMGAVQAVPQAAYLMEPGRDSQSRPDGLLVFSPGKRGRYGFRRRDQIGILPHGPGTFGLVDFSDRLMGLPVAQFHGGGDILSSRDCLKDFTTSHRLWDFPLGNHSFGGACDRFLSLITEGIDWLLQTDEAQ